MHCAKFAIVFIASWALSTGTMAQKIYKCGASYSQIPCPDGVAMDASDARTNAQKSEADKSTKNQAKQAQALEKERLTDEARARAADQAQVKAQGKGKLADKEPVTKKKSKEPDFFTAKPTPAPKN